MALPVRVERGYFNDPFELARRDFDSLLSRFGGGLFGGGDESGALSLSNYGVDIREDADHIYVEADMPGFRKEDIDITLQEGNLTITAQRREESPTADQTQQAQQPTQGQHGQQVQQGRRGQQGQRQGDYLLHERRCQQFVRSFTLPTNVDEQSVQARLDEGVLKLTLNKREDAKPRRIQVS
jgi:HSP20 family protein